MILNPPNSFIMKFDKLVTEMMTAAEFSLIREKKHRVWKHHTGAIITTAKTVSDQRALKNIKRDIRRALQTV